jgi:hypothetical protein
MPFESTQHDPGNRISRLLAPHFLSCTGVLFFLKKV